MDNTIKPFKVHVSDADIADLKQRLQLTRWPDQIPNTEWRYGAKTDYIQQLCDYWQHHYDWRKHEARLNQFAQFTTGIDAHDIHFIHARSQHANAVPLLISHGWPGTIVEFLNVIDPVLSQRS